MEKDIENTGEPDHIISGVVLPSIENDNDDDKDEDFIKSKKIYLKPKQTQKDINKSKMACSPLESPQINTQPLDTSNTTHLGDQSPRQNMYKQYSPKLDVRDDKITRNIKTVQRENSLINIQRENSLINIQRENLPSKRHKKRSIDFFNNISLSKAGNKKEKSENKISNISADSEKSYNGFLIVNDFKNINIDNIDTLFKEYTNKHCGKTTTKEIMNRIEQINDIDSLEDIYDECDNKDNGFETSQVIHSLSKIFKKAKTVNNQKFQNMEIEEIEIEEIEDFINKRHAHIDNNFKEFSLLITYIKGQKNMLVFANNVHLFKYYFYLFLILIFSICATVTAGENKCYESLNSLIAVLNICITLFTTLKDLFNYKTKSDVAIFMIEQYNKLELDIDTTNSKLIVNENDFEKRTILKEKTVFLEEKINEIKDIFHYQSIDEVNNVFFITSTLKLFSFLKLVKMYEKILFLKLTNIINEIRFIFYKWKTNDSLFIQQESFQNAAITHQRNEMPSTTAEKNPFKSFFPSKLAELERVGYLLNFKDFIKNEFLNTRNINNKINTIDENEFMNSKKQYIFWAIFKSLFNAPPNENPNENEIFTSLMIL